MKLFEFKLAKPCRISKYYRAYRNRTRTVVTHVEEHLRVLTAMRDTRPWASANSAKPDQTPRSDAAKCGVQSGSPLFANKVSFKSLIQMKNTTQQP